jgi:hypothetical protein
LVVCKHDEALPRGIVASGAGVVGVAKPVVRGIEEPPEHHWVRYTYPCEVAGGRSLAEPWDDSSSAEALGSLTTGSWQPGRTPRAAASVLAEVTYTIMAPRSPMGKRGPETKRSPVEMVVVSPVVASRCETTRAARRRSVRASCERRPER